MVKKEDVLEALKIHNDKVANCDACMYRHSATCMDDLLKDSFEVFTEGKDGKEQ